LVGAVLIVIVAYKVPILLLVIAVLVVIFALLEINLRPKIEALTDELRDINQNSTRSHVRYLMEQQLIRVSSAGEYEQKKFF
jgi:hypothetical protein